MKIFVVAKTNVKKEFVERIDEMNFRVGVNAIPEKGRANEKIIKLLAEFFDVAPSRIVLRSGATSKKKAFELM